MTEDQLAKHALGMAAAGMNALWEFSKLIARRDNPEGLADLEAKLKAGASFALSIVQDGVHVRAVLAPVVSPFPPLDPTTWYSQEATLNELITLSQNPPPDPRSLN